MAACSMLTCWTLEVIVDAEVEIKDNLINWLHLSLQAFVKLFTKHFLVYSS